MPSNIRGMDLLMELQGGAKMQFGIAVASEHGCQTTKMSGHRTGYGGVHSGDSSFVREQPVVEDATRIVIV